VISSLTQPPLSYGSPTSLHCYSSISSYPPPIPLDRLGGLELLSNPNTIMTSFLALADNEERTRSAGLGRMRFEFAFGFAIGIGQRRWSACVGGVDVSTGASESAESTV